MKNKKGFTLIELLAVMIILAVIMTIAIPNVVSTIDRNKKDSFIEDAKRMISLAEYEIRGDTSIEFPKANTVTVITLERMNTTDIVDSPYDTKYCKSKSYVAIILNAAGEYEYYAQLVACTDAECANIDDNSVSQNRGVNLASLAMLNSKDRFDAKVLASGSNVIVADIGSQEEYIKTTLGRSSVDFYS